MQLGVVSGSATGIVDGARHPKTDSGFSRAGTFYEKLYISLADYVHYCTYTVARIIVWSGHFARSVLPPQAKAGQECPLHITNPHANPIPWDAGR
jgi:hypothetical protein